MLAIGLDLGAIASHLQLSEAEVASRLESLQDRFGVHDRTEIVTEALRRDWIRFVEAHVDQQSASRAGMRRT